MSKQLNSGQYFGEAVKVQLCNYFDFSLFTYPPGETIENHYHDNPYLSLPINGGYYEYSNSGKKAVQPGQLVYRPAGYAHSNQFPGKGVKCLNIEIKRHFLAADGFDADLPLHENFHYLACPEFYKAAYYFQAGMGKAFCEEIMMSWVCSLSKTKEIKPDPAWFRKLKQAIADEPMAFHSIYSLADKACVHPVYLARAFKENTGMTLGEYQLKTKLQRSLQWLYCQDYSIGEVAHASGFYDPAHYIKTFKLYFDVTPRRYRVKLNS